MTLQDKLATLTYEKAKKILLDMAADRPDYVYPKVRVNPADTTAQSCAYFDPQTHEPSCIVGHVMAAIGITRHDLAVHENVDMTIFTLARERHLEMDFAAKSLLMRAQGSQDDGVTWGQAVDDAIAFTEGRFEDAA